jgi:tetratricopeptide (TPR) repeat protein
MTTGDEPSREIRQQARATGSGQIIQVGGDATISTTQPLPSRSAERHTLPADAASFTGRDVELERLMKALPGQAEAGGVVPIDAIDGLAGIGKTAFAVHVAHQLAARFPNGQLFLRLHAHTPGQRPVEPIDALAALLQGDGVVPQLIPASLDERAALWRDRIAGRKLILVLDDADSSSQVEPLLPGSAGALVLITSRHRLAALPAALPVTLDVLKPGDAVKMFTGLVGRRRLRRRGADAAEIVALCGYLPLAISLMAGQLKHHATWTTVDLAAELRTATDRLALMAAENISVAAAFDLSYRSLSDDQQHLFRRLGLHPGTTIDVYAAAALTEFPLPQAARHLEALLNECLITEAGYRRYGMHDLIRRYAQDLAAAEPVTDRHEALEHLLDYYQHTAALADAMLNRQPRTRPTSSTLISPPTSSPELGDLTHALSWARTERANLLSCIDHATRAGQHARVIALTAALTALMRRDGPWTEAITCHSAAAKAARHLGDRLAEANALTDLGVARHLSGDYSGGAEALDEALGIYREIGDQLGQANALTELGVVRRHTGDFSGSKWAMEMALGIYRSLNARQGQATALEGLGLVWQGKGNYPAAVKATEEALSIYSQLGDQLGHAKTLAELGVIRRLTGDYAAAIQELKTSLSIYRHVGYRLGEANVLKDLGIVLEEIGEYSAAVEDLQQALAIFPVIGDRLGQANALTGLGDVRLATGDYPAATTALEAALALYADLASRRGRANALCSLGAVRRLTGDYAGAAEALDKALRLYRDLGDRGGEVLALNQIGTLHHFRNDLTQATAWHRQALDLAREIDSPWDEAHALAGLGRCAQAAGHTAEAATNLGEALAVFQQIGTAEATSVALELKALTDEGPATPN